MGLELIFPRHLSDDSRRYFIEARNPSLEQAALRGGNPAGAGFTVLLEANMTLKRGKPCLCEIRRVWQYRSKEIARCG